MSELCAADASTGLGAETKMHLRGVDDRRGELDIIGAGGFTKFGTCVSGPQFVPSKTDYQSCPF
jgi:hypothetical protein